MLTDQTAACSKDPYQPPSLSFPNAMRHQRLQELIRFGTRLLNAEYAISSARLAGFFGVTHAEALVALLGEGGLQSLLATLSQHIDELLQYGCIRT